MLVISTFLFGKFPTKGGNYRMSAYACAYALLETSLKENIQLHAVILIITASVSQNVCQLFVTAFSSTCSAFQRSVHPRLCPPPLLSLFSFHLLLCLLWWVLYIEFSLKILVINTFSIFVLMHWSPQILPALYTHLPLVWNFCCISTILEWKSFFFNLRSY